MCPSLQESYHHDQGYAAGSQNQRRERGQMMRESDTTMTPQEFNNFLIFKSLVNH